MNACEPYEQLDIPGSRTLPAVYESLRLDSANLSEPYEQLDMHSRAVDADYESLTPYSQQQRQSAIYCNESFAWVEIEAGQLLSIYFE